MTALNLASANILIAAALGAAREANLKSMSIAVLDAGGHLIAFAREDGASTLRPQIAVGKAAGALALGMSSRKIGEMAIERPGFFTSLAALAPDGIVAAAGGIQVVDSAGTTIGAVGMTGDLSDKDEACVLAGLEAAGLTPAE